MADTVRILGIDPGSRVTGWGVVDSDGRRSCHVASGHIRTAGGDLASRLAEIFHGVSTLVGEYRPVELAIERVFVNRNADSALKLGHARAAAICATFDAGIDVFEYAARAVKLAVVGTGAADKAQVAHMVGMLLGCRERLQPDEADALAVAICHAHSRGVAGLVRFPRQASAS
ncbi:MAG: crossover junction endodeoxyribonuclease RuvC [Chromatiales bacterium]|nr:crossover junction endodeoxyribonuclease RuvC [Chromatiales bacterium]